MYKDDAFTVVAKAAIAKWGNDYLRAVVRCFVLTHLYTPHPKNFRHRGLAFSLALWLVIVRGTCVPSIGI